MGSSVDQYAVGVLLLGALVSKATTYSIPWDSDCGSTKGCFPDCKGGCDYLVTWQNLGSSINFTLSAVETSYDVYLAIAFSDDYRMGDDSVVACLVPNNSIESSYNEGTDNNILSPPTYGLTVHSYPSYTGWIISCGFRRNTTAQDIRFFDLNNDYYIQLVVGEVENKHYRYKLKKHREIPWFSDRKVDFQSNEIVGAYKLNSPLVKLHGILMVLAWLMFSMIGIMTARHNKNMLPDTKLFGTKVWFQVHRSLMVAVVVCVVTGFIAIFVEIKGYSQITPGENGVVQAHPVLGIVITCFALLNPIGALFRPGPDHKFRWIFNWAHFAAGVITQFLAVLSIMFGYFTDRAKLSSAPAIVTAVHLFVVIFFFVFLEVRKWAGAGNQDNVKVSTGAVQLESKQKQKDERETRRSTDVSFLVLIVFTIVTCGFACGILGIIAAG